MKAQEAKAITTEHRARISREALEKAYANISSACVQGDSWCQTDNLSPEDIKQLSEDGYIVRFAHASGPRKYFLVSWD